MSGTLRLISKSLFFVSIIFFAITVWQVTRLDFTTLSGLMNTGGRVVVYVFLTALMLSGLRFVPARGLYAYEFLGIHIVLPAGPWWILPWMEEVLKLATTDDMPTGELARKFFKPVKARTKGGGAIEVNFTAKMRIPDASALEALLAHVPVSEPEKRFDIARRNVVEILTAVFESMVSQEDLRDKEKWPERVLEVEEAINERLGKLFDDPHSDLWYELELNITVPVSEAETVAKRRDEAAAIEQFVTTLVKGAVASGLFKTEEEAREHAMKLAALKFGAEAIGDGIGRALAAKPGRKHRDPHRRGSRHEDDGEDDGEVG